ncbi:MAG: hypothetical protein COB02_18080 [Candidatus Cloacimonadota bacterium]|nr:MAG: hypothetical protein COB02_18080 [Candidatus Cloacimonadota bacterium]
MTNKNIQEKAYGDITKTLNRGKYEEIRALGSGQAATVYLCRGTDELKQEYAIKRVELSGDEQEQEISLKEAKRLVSLRHRFLPKVIEIFSEANHHYMVMDYVAMGTLESYLKELSSLAREGFVISSLKTIFLNLLEVMTYIHNQKVLHLDLKPDNILIDGNSLEIRLIDFELARGFGTSSGDYAKVKKHATHNWAAQEVKLQNNVSIQSDIFSLGGILFTLSHNFKAPPEFPNKNKYDHFIDVIDKCLQIDPSERYTSVNELKGAFEKAIGQVDNKGSNNFKSSPVISSERANKSPKKSYNLKITTSPKRCKLKIKGQNTVLATPQDLYLDEGLIEISLSANKHNDLSESFDLTEDMTKHFDLTPKRGLLTVTSEPDAIYISVNGKGCYTPLTNFAVDSDSDRVELILEEEGYKALDANINLLNGDVVKHFKLKKLIKKVETVEKPKTVKKEKVEQVKIINALPTKIQQSHKPTIKIFQNMDFALIPAGDFMMGSPESEVDRVNDEFLHKVTISKSFYMQTTPITQKQWFEVMKNRKIATKSFWQKLMGDEESQISDNPSNFKGDDLPVEKVSFKDIQVFLKTINSKIGFKDLDVIKEIDAGKLLSLPSGCFRLPTEAEWEYACRAGTSTVFSFGDVLSSKLANYNGNYPYNGAAEDEYRGKTTIVKTFGTNDFGLYDMHGNVWEWVQDYFDDDYYKKNKSTDPVNIVKASYRVFRGGSWDYFGRYLRSAYRSGSSPFIRYDNLGFRLLVVR